MLLSQTIRTWSWTPFFAAALCLCAGVSSAQISLGSAVDLAVRADPKVRVAQADLDRARASLSEAHSAYAPTAGVSGGVGYSRGVPLGLPIVFSVSSQSLVFSFSQRDYIRAAHAGVDSATLSLLEVRGQVTEDVVSTYLSLDEAQQRQVAMNQAYGYATRLQKIVQDRVDAGQDAHVDLLHARRTVAQIHLQQLHDDEDIAALSDHLSRLLGMPGTSLTTVPASIPTMAAPSASTASGVPSPQDTPGLRAAFANARARQETAFGDARYLYRPQFSLGANYSRISTAFNNYAIYYPGFNDLHNFSFNSESVGISITIPFVDRAHQARARASAAEARRALADAENQRNVFLDGRFKLQHAAEELSAKADLAEIDRDLAQDQLQTVLLQLSSTSSSGDAPLMTPKDEQNARLQERQRYIDLLDAQLQLKQSQVSLMRQTGELDDWLRTLSTQLPANTTVTAP